MPFLRDLHDRLEPTAETHWKPEARSGFPAFQLWFDHWIGSAKKARRAMYGTASTFRIPAGKEQAFREVYLKEGAAYCAGLDGFVAEYLLQPDDAGEDWASLTIFDSETSYRKTTTDPAIHAVYRKLVEILGEEPRWQNGQITLAEARSVAL